MALATLLACNALTGVGDLEAVDCNDGCDGAIPERTDGPGPEGAVAVDATSDAASSTDSAAPGDSGGDSGGDAAQRPSFCTGISFYLPFDGTLNTRAGQAPDAPPAISFVPGKFGQAADLTAASGIAVYYASSHLGTPSYALVNGTVAMWVKPTFVPPTALPALFFKPRTVRAAATPNAGPVLGLETRLGLTVDAPDGGLTEVGYPQATLPNWNALGWNHLVGTWSSSSPTLQFALNGAAPIGTPNPWVPNESPVNFLRVGSEVSEPRSLFDEVVLWKRVLPAGEIAALAASKVSVGVACGL